MNRYFVVVYRFMGILNICFPRNRCESSPNMALVTMRPSLKYPANYKYNQPLKQFYKPCFSWNHIAKLFSSIDYSFLQKRGQNGALFFRFTGGYFIFMTKKKRNKVRGHRSSYPRFYHLYDHYVPASSEIRIEPN